MTVVLFVTNIKELVFGKDSFQYIFYSTSNIPKYDTPKGVTNNFEQQLTMDRSRLWASKPCELHDGPPSRGPDATRPNNECQGCL